MSTSQEEAMDTVQDLGAKERELIERVTFKIASCQTDLDLEEAVVKFLPMVLLKLSSSNESVRTKVMELLVHVNKRLKSRPQIRLPVTQLLLQYQDPTATSFVTNFTIIYLKMGIPRMEVEEQVKVVPLIMGSIESKPQTHQDSLLLMLMPLMTQVPVPANALLCKNLLGFADNPWAGKLFADFAFDMLLLPYTATKLSEGTETGSSGSHQVPVQVPPGMSRQSLKRVTYESTLTPEQLEKVKVALIKILARGPFKPEEVAAHLVVACSDSRHSVATIGDDELKRMQASVDWEDVELTKRLYSLFLGTVVPKDANKCTIKPEMRREPANTRIRLKVVPFLMKSSASCKMMVPAIQSIFECLNGKDTKSNLRSKGLLFASHFCQNCPEKSFSSVAPVLFSEMKKIAFKKQEEVTDDIKTDLFMRNLSLTIIPKILSRERSLLRNDLSFITTFLNFLSHQSSSVSAGQEFKLVTKSALSELIPVLTKIIEDNSDVKVMMESIVLMYFENESSEVREVVVRYAATLFPQKHVPSKFILLLALGDHSAEVRKVASDSIDSLKKAKNWPLFTEIMSYVKIKTKIVKKVTITAEMLSYIHSCLENEICSGDNSWVDDKEQLEALRKFVKISFESRVDAPSNWEALIIYTDWLQSLTFNVQIGQIRSRFVSLKDVSYYLLEIFLALPRNSVKLIITNESLWRSALSVAERQNDDSMDNLCQVAAFLMDVFVTPSSRQSIVNELLGNAEKTNSQIESKMVHLLSVAYYLIDYGKGPENEESIKKVLDLSVSWIDSKSVTSAKTCACRVIDEAAKANLLANNLNIEQLVEKLSSLLPSTDKNLHLEEGVTKALGLICAGNENLDQTLEQKIVDTLMTKGSQVQGITYHFTLGDALSCAILKSTVLYKRLASTVENAPKCSSETLAGRAKEADRIIKKILETYIVHSKKSIRSAACVWILCLLRSCGSLLKTLDAVHVNMQHALLRLMNSTVVVSDETAVTCITGDVTEDITPKALSLIYEIAPDAVKPLLIKDLNTVISFVGSDTSSQTAPNLVAMREVALLAAECADKPELFYLFMNVISYQRWGSTSKSRHFFIASQFRSSFLKTIEPFKDKLLPQLYLNLYDPHSVTRGYFTAIWDFIVVSGQRVHVLNNYLIDIINLINDNLENSQWRKREAACGALSNMLTLGSYSFKPHVDAFSTLFDHCFRVADDMKETVRTKAELALKALIKTTVELCSSSLVGSQTSEKSLKVVLPTIVETGLTNSAKSIRKYSLKAVIEITEAAGPALKQHIPVLVPCYLDALTIFESEALNYLSVRLESDNEVHEKLDAARVSSIHSSPIMGALKQCIPFIDADVLQELMPRVVEIIRSSVGLCTKAGACFFVIQLVNQCPNELQPYSEKVIKALLKNLSNRNATIQKCSADAIGHLIKLPSDKSTESLLKAYREHYFEDDSKYRKVIAILMQTIAKYSGDVVRKHASLILPFAFYAMHEPKDIDPETSEQITQIVEIYEELWIEFTPGSESGTKLYFKEILLLVYQGLESQVWINKYQAAKCLTVALEKIGNSVDREIVLKLVKDLKDCLFGRTWNGKESILFALKSLVILNRDVIAKIPLTEDGNVDQIIDSMLKECNKKSISYKKAALQATCEVIECFESNLFRDFYTTHLYPLLAITEYDLVPKDPDIDQDEEQIKETTIDMQLTAMIALRKSWPKTKYSLQAEYFNQIAATLSRVYSNGVYKVKINSIQSLVVMVKSLQVTSESDVSLHKRVFVDLVEQVVNESLSTSKYPELQSQGLELMDVIWRKLNDTNSKEAINSQKLVNVLHQIETENANGLIRDKAKTLLKKL